MSSQTVVVCILFHEKVAQTIECVQSFLPANVPIVVLNNGSSTESIDKFTLWVGDYAQVRLLNAPYNLGVSGGRNLLIRETTEEWLLFVDNDIVMDSPDWFDTFQKYTSKNVEVIIPRLYNHHDGCYAEFKSIEIKDGNAYFVPGKDNCLNSFPGGASFVNRNLFKRLGNYDEEFFVGVEDFELSLRAVLTGNPIRALLISDIELTHSHLMLCATEDDVRAVRNRYNKDVLRKSYNRISEKYKLFFEDFWEGWVDQQVMSLKISPPLSSGTSNNNETPKRPRIALVADADNWAFANISRNIETHLSFKYDFSVYYSGNYAEDYDGLLSNLYENGHDLVHFFWRGNIICLYMHLLRTRQSRSDSVFESFIQTKTSFSIYDHCLLNDSDLLNYQVVFKYLTDGYVVSSERLFHIYSKMTDYPCPYRVIEDGVDISKFWPVDTLRFLETDRPFVVGWAGNSLWGSDINATDYKGLNTIIKPAIAQLKREGFNVVGRFADRNVEHISYENMVDYYNSIDVYVCASSIEGTPNPVLEAMACGVPVISTDVGIVPQLFGLEQKKNILICRTVDALKEKLIILMSDPEQRMKLSNENLHRIHGWTRELEIPKWDDFFSGMLNLENDKQAFKRACLEVPYNFGIESTIEQFLKNSLSWRVTRPLREFRWHALRLRSQLMSKLRSCRTSDMA